MNGGYNKSNEGKKHAEKRSYPNAQGSSIVQSSWCVRKYEGIAHGFNGAPSPK